MEQKQSRFMSFSPEMVKLREEFKKEYGNTEIFDYFYTGLCQRIGKSVSDWALRQGGGYGK